MKLVAAGLIAVLLTPSPAVAQAPPVDRSADRQQITALLARWENAWNTHDMRAFGTMFHEDGTWILWTGAVWVGRRAISECFAELRRAPSGS